MIRFATAGIRRIAYLRQFLAPEYEFFRNAKAVAGWGRKPTAQKAIAYARKHRLPYIALEDGFLRSVGLGVHKAAPVSLLVDSVGVYYDATAPSAVENDVNDFERWFTESVRQQAEAAMRSIMRLDLSKYNAAPLCPEDWPGPENGAVPGPYVLCVDQTQGDASVSLGLADAASFERMLRDALRENPDATVLIKTHPDVVAGAKKGYLTEWMKTASFEGGRRPVVLRENFAPIGLMRRCRAVYAVTSQSGFEALLAGVPVFLYGTPFYAGWGLTTDRGKSVPRRRARAPLVAVFAAAYMRLARYVSPVTGQPLTLQQAVDFLADARRAENLNRAGAVAACVPRWKRPMMRAFLSAPDMGGRVEFVRDFDEALARALERRAPLAVWASEATPERSRRAREAGVVLWRTEDAFIRSVGLGSDYELPYSLAFDTSGIYFDPGSGSDLESIYRDMVLNPDKYVREIERARRLIPLLCRYGITKYNNGRRDAKLPETPKDKRVILVTGQVDGDMSVRRGGGAIQSNRELLETVREENPDAHLIYLEHPDVARGNRPGKIGTQTLRRLADQTISGTSVLELIGICDELHVLTSLSGFEALLRGVKVVTYGRPFYAGWGLTCDKLAFDNRIGGLSLEALAAGALIVYPRYYDWDTKQFCRCEDVCVRMIEGRRAPIALWVRGVRLLRDILKRLHLYERWLR